MVDLRLSSDELRESSARGHHFAWDPHRLEQAHDDLFDPQWWRERGALTGQAEGRGAAFFLDGFDGRPWVLRHNRRGGLLARINHDRFLWTGATRARALRELRLLAELHVQGLPVPAPVAARAVRRGPVYRADVITEQIVDSQPLADRLARQRMPATSWQKLGAMLARFHGAGVWHADLNARNVLVDSGDQFYLIDLDKARRRTPGRWRAANLARLRRSLDKFRRADHTFRFSEPDWAALRGGYVSFSATL